MSHTGMDGLTLKLYWKLICADKVSMGSTKLEKVKFSVERKAKGTRRMDVYAFVLAIVFILTFIVTQILLGVYYV